MERWVAKYGKGMGSRRKGKVHTALKSYILYHRLSWISRLNLENFKFEHN